MSHSIEKPLDSPIFLPVLGGQQETNILLEDTLLLFYYRSFFFAVSSEKIYLYVSIGASENLMEVFVRAIIATVWSSAEITLVSSLVRNVSIGFDVVTLLT